MVVGATNVARKVQDVYPLGGRCLWSWGNEILDSHNGKLGSEYCRVLDAVEVFEASPVIRAMSYGTATVEVRGASMTRLQIEKAISANDRELRRLEHPRYEEIKRAMSRARRLGVKVPATGGRK